MHQLSKAQALGFLNERAQVFAAPGNPLNPFATLAWVEHFMTEVVADDSAVLAPEAMGEDGTSVMLLCSDGSSAGRCSSLSNYYTSLYSPMASSARDRRAAMASLVRQLTERRPRIGVVNFAPLDAQAPDTAALSGALGEQGWFVRTYFAFGNWTLPCEGLDFARYMAGRDSRLQNTCSRKTKKLLAAGDVRIVTSPSEVDAAMDEYDSVYARSWKQPEPYPNFVRGWARRCAKHGWLRLGIARIDGQPIAAQFWFVFERHAYIFKLAYDEIQAKWSAGTVLTAHLMRHVLDVDHVVEVDYLTGDDEYKKSWMAQRRERIGLIACNLRSATGMGRAAVEMAGEVRARLRPSSPVTA